MSNACHIVAKDLGVTFGDGHAALRNVSFQCPAGGFLTVVGPSGCGKSTLLRCLAGLQQPTEGELVVHSPNESSPPRRAFVFQDANLLPWRGVLQNVTLPLELAGQPRHHTLAVAKRAIQVAGLAPDDCDRRPCMLSGGMRMRTSLARALVTEPQLMLLDEPFAALDDLSRQQLNMELMQLWMAQGWTSVLVTHNVAEAVFLSERVLVLSQRPGRVTVEVPIPFSYPRSTELRASAEFARISEDIAKQLRQAAY